MIRYFWLVLIKSQAKKQNRPTILMLTKHADKLTVDGELNVRSSHGKREKNKSVEQAATAHRQGQQEMRHGAHDAKCKLTSRKNHVVQSHKPRPKRDWNKYNSFSIRETETVLEN